MRSNHPNPAKEQKTSPVNSRAGARPSAPSPSRGNAGGRSTAAQHSRGWKKERPEVVWWGLNPAQKTSEASCKLDKLGLATVAGFDLESDSRLRQETDS